MKIGRRIYYEKDTGNLIIDTGEREGYVESRTVEQDIATFTVLSERNRETFDMIELAFGEYGQNFAECNGYRVNRKTKKLEFSYPEPGEPEAPQVFGPPLTEQIEELKAENTLLKAQNQAISERTDFHEDLIADMAMMIYQ
ncbi:hypothetical protein ACQKIC_16360 [Peribacillus sp. NPDC046944]|uniref:hypothetical protein n=1 Tax=unclassified Peribacillus TaxID=2675266 RepID=UPI003D04DBD7